MMGRQKKKRDIGIRDYVTAQKTAEDKPLLTNYTQPQRQDLKGGPLTVL